MSYDLVIAGPPPDVAQLCAAIGFRNGPGALRVLPEPDSQPEPGVSWPENGFQIFREGLSTRTTGLAWHKKGEKGELRIIVRALASPADCDLALALAEAAAVQAGAPVIGTDYFGDVAPADLRRLHTQDWMDEQAASGTRVLAALVREKQSPMSMPGPVRSCLIGPRLLADLEANGPAAELPNRVLATMRRVQWNVPASFRDAAVFVAGGSDGKERQTQFAAWLPGEDLVLPWVDFVALRVSNGDVLMVPFEAVRDLAGELALPLDECQLLVRAASGDDWAALVERARPLATKPPRRS